MGVDVGVRLPLDVLGPVAGDGVPRARAEARLVGVVSEADVERLVRRPRVLFRDPFRELGADVHRRAAGLLAARDGLHASYQR